jgi:hypothetical protein
MPGPAVRTHQWRRPFERSRSGTHCKGRPATLFLARCCLRPRSRDHRYIAIESGTVVVIGNPRQTGHEKTDVYELLPMIVARSALHISLSLWERVGVRETIMAPVTYIFRGGAGAMIVWVRGLSLCKPRSAKESCLSAASITTTTTTTTEVSGCGARAAASFLKVMGVRAASGSRASPTACPSRAWVRGVNGSRDRLA